MWPVQKLLRPRGCELGTPRAALAEVWRNAIRFFIMGNELIVSRRDRVSEIAACLSTYSSLCAKPCKKRLKHGPNGTVMVRAGAC